VFIEISDRIALYDPQKQRFFTWMFNIAHRRSLAKKDEVRQPDVLPQDAQKSGSDVPATTPMAGFAQTINLLSAGSRTLLELWYYRGQTPEQIAGTLNISPDTIRDRVKVALLEFKGIMHKDGY